MDVRGRTVGVVRRSSVLPRRGHKIVSHYRRLAANRQTRSSTSTNSGLFETQLAPPLPNLSGKALLRPASALLNCF
jgi:hypothetical protein